MQKSESEVAQLCLTLCDPVNYSLLGSSVSLAPPGKPSSMYPGVSLSVMSYSEKAMAPHSSTLASIIPWTEEPGGLQFMGSLRVRYD